MPKALILLLLVSGPVATLVVVFMLPRWFPRRLHLHRVWRLRDAVVDDIIAGGLPKDHPAVVQLVQLMEVALRARRLTLLDVYLFTWSCRGMDSATINTMRREAKLAPLTGLTPGQKAKVNEYRERFNILMVGAMLLGSWFGLAHVATFIPIVLVRGARNVAKEGSIPIRDRSLHHLETGIVVTGRTATDTAVTDSRLGRHLGNLTARKWPFLLPDAGRNPQLAHAA
jgi:hypothetical protein